MVGGSSGLQLEAAFHSKQLSPFFLVLSMRLIGLERLKQYSMEVELLFTHLTGCLSVCKGVVRGKGTTFWNETLLIAVPLTA